VYQKKQHLFFEHTMSPSGEQNFKHPNLGNRWTKIEIISLFFLDFAVNNISKNSENLRVWVTKYQKIC